MHQVQFINNKQQKYFHKKQTLTNAFDFSKATLTGLAHCSGMTINYSAKNPLTIREMTCLILLAVGKKPDQCADLLGISPRSVKTYEQRIREKLGATSRIHAFYLATSSGYIKLSEAVV